jgi:outer membrane protein TolC
MQLTIRRAARPGTRESFTDRCRGSLRPLAATVLSVIVTGAAAQPVAPLSLDEALRLAEQRSALIDAADQSVAAATDRAIAGAQLPDPVLRAGVDNVPVEGADRFTLGRDFMTMRRIGVMQEFTGTDKRRLRRERGERAVAREQAVRALAVTELKRAVASTWLDRAWAAQASRLVESLLDELNLQVRTLEAGVRSGRSAALDLRAAQAMVIVAQDQLAASRQQESSAVRQLARWLGDDAERPIDSLPDTDTLAAGAIASVTDIAHHAELAVAREDEALAESEARLARRSKSPDWSVEVAYQQRGAGFADMVSFGVAVPLPLFAADRQDREIRASRAALAQARATREDMERQHRAELRTLVDEWQRLGQRIAALRTSLLPLAQDRIALALAAYRGGSATLAQVLDTRRAEVEARAQVLALQRDRARVWAQLSFRGATTPVAPRTEDAR